MATIKRVGGHKDPVTPEVYEAVMVRDTISLTLHAYDRGFRPSSWSTYLERFPLCVAPILDDEQKWSCKGRTTLDHVKDAPMMGKRAPSDPQHLVAICAQHHLDTGWATSHRPELRDYLKGFRA